MKPEAKLEDIQSTAPLEDEQYTPAIGVMGASESAVRGMNWAREHEVKPPPPEPAAPPRVINRRAKKRQWLSEGEGGLMSVAPTYRRTLLG